MTLNSFVLVFAAGVALVSAEAQPRPVTPEDYYLFENITDARISPDGRQVAYVVTQVDRKQNRRRSDIWLAQLAGDPAPRQFTREASSTHPRWQPGGRALAFLSERDGKRQVFRLPLDGGEATLLTHLRNGISDFAWSPDGMRLAVVSRSGPSSTSDVKHYVSPNYKYNGPGFFDRTRSHIWVVEVATGQARQITSGDQRNDVDPTWSPDGMRIAFSSQRTDCEPGQNSDIQIVAADGGAPVSIATQHGNDESPRWSPDGLRIAYVASQSDEDTAKVWIVPSGGGVARSASAKQDLRLDLAAARIAWGADGKSVTFVAGVKGEQHLFRIDLASEEITTVTSGARYIANVDAHAASGTMVYSANDSRHLDDLYAASLDGRGERRLTRLNAELYGQLQLQEVERVRYKSVDGQEIDGFFLRPVGWREGTKYPMVLSIHGGPANMYGVNWFHEAQVYASRGWAVFYANPRGSSGYGEKFKRSVEKEWGGKAYEDLMSGVDAMLAKYPWIDRDRLGVTGGSYGGFMTNWIVGHTTRFKAAVTLRSISNFTSVEGTRDAAYGHKHDFGGDLFQNFDFFWKMSPLRYAPNVKTPTLVLHSDNDQRVPLEQGEQWFRALQHFGVVSEFVIFPRENHDLTRNGEPKHLVESLQWQVYWFDRFLNGNANAIPPDRN